MPTDLGERLRAHAERVEHEVHSLVDVADKHERAVEGRVRLACTEALAVQTLIPTLLPKLRAKHPKLYVDLVTSDEVTDLSARDADLALRFFRPTHGSLRAQRLATLPVGPIASRAYSGREALGARARLDRLRAHPQAHRGERLVRARARRAPCASHQRLPRVRRSGARRAGCVDARDRGVSVGSIAAGAPCFSSGLLPALELWIVAPSTVRGVPRVDVVWDALVEAGTSLGAKSAKSALKQAALPRGTTKRVRSLR